MTYKPANKLTDPSLSDLLPRGAGRPSVRLTDWCQPSLSVRGGVRCVVLPALPVSGFHPQDPLRQVQPSSGCAGACTGADDPGA